MRDRKHDQSLERDGWRVLRFWETEIHRDAEGLAKRVALVVRERRSRLG